MNKRSPRKITHSDIKTMVETFVDEYFDQVRYRDVEAILGPRYVDEVLDALEVCRIEVKWKTSPSSNRSQR